MYHTFDGEAQGTEALLLNPADLGPSAPPVPLAPVHQGALLRTNRALPSPGSGVSRRLLGAQHRAARMLSHFPGAAALGETGWLGALRAHPAKCNQNLTASDYCSMEPLARLADSSPTLPSWPPCLRWPSPPHALPGATRDPQGCCYIPGGCGGC